MINLLIQKKHNILIKILQEFNSHCDKKYDWNQEKKKKAKFSLHCFIVNVLLYSPSFGKEKNSPFISDPSFIARLILQ